MTRDINIVVVLTVAAQAAAFVKSVLVAYFFGVSAELDGYFLAQVVPAVVTGTSIGILQSSFVPAYVQLRTERRMGEASALAGRMLQVIAIAGAGLAACVALLAPEVVRMTAPLAEPAVASAATYSLRVLSVLLLMNAVADFLALLLNAELRFAAAALAPIANASVASVVLLAKPELGLVNLVWGTLLGLAAQIAVLAYALRRARVGIRLSGGGGLALQVGRRGIAALPSVVVANVAANLPSLLAATLGAGAVSAFSYAWKLNLAVTQAAGIAIGTVMLPHFAEMLARRDHASIRAALGRVVPLVLAIGCIGIVWIWVAGEPFLRAALQRGRFSTEDVQYVHGVWFLLALGLAPSVASIALAKVIQAASSFAQLAWFGLAGVITLYTTSALLMPTYAAQGVAAGVVASAWTVFALCAIAVARRVPAATSGARDLRLRSLLAISVATASATALLRPLHGEGDAALLAAATAFSACGALWLVRSR